MDIDDDGFGETLFRTAAHHVGAQAQGLLMRRASLDGYAVLLVHKSSPHHGLVEREGAQVLDDGTIMRLELRHAAVTWLHARGLNAIAREIGDAKGDRLVTALLHHETASLHWVAKPAFDTTSDRGVRLLPADAEAWSAAQLEALGLDLLVTAHELAFALEQGASPDDVVYLRIETDCPLFVPMREAVPLMPGGESVALGPETEAFSAVMSRVLITQVMEKFAGRGLAVSPAGCVSLVRMTRMGVVSTSARLVRLAPEQSS